MDIKSKRITKEISKTSQKLWKISSCFLSFCFLSLCVLSFLNTRQQTTRKIGQLEAVKLNLEDSMVSVEDKKEGRAKNKNLWKDNSMTWKRKQANWKIESPRLSSSTKSTWVTAREGSSVFRTWLGRRTNPTILKNEFAKSQGRRGCTLAMFWNEIESLKEDEWWNKKEMMKCGIDGRARMEKRTRREAKWQQRTRRDRSLTSRVVQFYQWCCSRWCRSWCHRFSTSLIVMERQIPLQNAIQRWCDQCPCRDALVVPTIQNKKKKLESFREPCELPDCLCSENCIVWTSIWAQTLINVVSSPPRSFLLYFVVTSLLKKILPAFSHFVPPYSSKTKIIMFYFLFWTCFPWSSESWKNL